jgi:hypothetical protein
MSSYKSHHEKRYYQQLPCKIHKPGPNARLHQGDKKVAEVVFQSRPLRSQSQDLIRLAPITRDLEAWLRTPNKLDFPNVDTPDAQLIFSHKSRRSQAQDLARAARRKVSLEIWIRDTAHSDLEGVDTKRKEPKTVKRFKICRKDQAKEAEKKQVEPKGRKLPTKPEIIQKAKEKFLEEQARMGLPTITPEEQELKEGGYFEGARAELMRGEESKVSGEVLKYIDDLRSELEPQGYTIVPI